MRRLRRHVAALLGVLLLQVIVLGAGAPCMPAGDGPIPSPAMHDGHEGHAGHEGMAVPDDGRGETRPGQGSSHCLVAMSCATMGPTAARTTLADDTVAVTTAIAARDDAAPASVGGAPEPPPPRG